MTNTEKQYASEIVIAQGPDGYSAMACVVKTAIYDADGKFVAHKDQDDRARTVTYDDLIGVFPDEHARSIADAATLLVANVTLQEERDRLDGENRALKQQCENHLRNVKALKGALENHFTKANETEEDLRVKLAVANARGDAAETDRDKAN